MFECVFSVTWFYFMGVVVLPDVCLCGGGESLGTGVIDSCDLGHDTAMWSWELNVGLLQTKPVL